MPDILETNHRKYTFLPVKNLEETALARGVTNLFVISSPIGELIYEHFGFQKIKLVEKERAGQKYVDTLMEKHF